MLVHLLAVLPLHPLLLPPHQLQERLTPKGANAQFYFSETVTQKETADGWERGLL